MPTLTRVFFTGAIASSLLLAASAEAAEPRPGLWKIVAVSERNGMTVGERRADTCLTAEQAKSLTEIQLDPAFDPKQDCKTVDTQRLGNSLTWRIQCSGSIPIETAALYVFDSPEHYSAVITTTLMIVRRPLTSTLRIEGQRVGECQR